MSPADPDAEPPPPGGAAHPRWLVPVLGMAATVLLVVAAVAGAAALAHRDDEAPQASGASSEPTDPRPRPEQLRAAGIIAFDPELPLDLSGVPGVTAEEEARASALVAEVGEAAGAYASIDDALAAGYVSVGDAFTGNEHLVDWANVVDDQTLDVDRPEALVYDVAPDGERTLAAFLFLLPPGRTLNDPPSVGGTLTTWTLWGDLCVGTDDPPEVAGTADAAGACPAGTELQTPSPALRVWVVRHPCGPFSELEGVGDETMGELLGACLHEHGL